MTTFIVNKDDDTVVDIETPAPVISKNLGDLREEAKSLQGAIQNNIDAETAQAEYEIARNAEKIRKIAEKNAPLQKELDEINGYIAGAELAGVKDPLPILNITQDGARVKWEAKYADAVDILREGASFPPERHGVKGEILELAAGTHTFTAVGKGGSAEMIVTVESKIVEPEPIV